MLPYKTLIPINKKIKTTIFEQITQQMIQLITKGILTPGQRVVSTRDLSETLNVHRRTVSRAYEDLISQGWLETKRASGTFVSAKIPEAGGKKLMRGEKPGHAVKAGFVFSDKPAIQRKALHSSSLKYHFDDGFPDPRLAPMNELARAYRRQLLIGNKYTKLGYGDTRGSLFLREQVAKHLHETRGLRINTNNVLIVRGTMMAYFLANMSFVKPRDTVVMGKLHWGSAKMISLHAGANVVEIPSDNDGMMIDQLEKVARRHKIRMIYITPHHEYPTAATLKAERRLQLLQLAERYGFIIFEDDYDFDFHYEGKPVLPLASADNSGLVIYCGSFTKTISPAFRVGYIVGPEDSIEYMAFHRRIIDRQGDTMLESAVADLLKEGVIEKHLRRSVKHYRQRRDAFCDLLTTHLHHALSFRVPEGGMSVWATFDKKINLVDAAQNAQKNGLYFSDGSQNGNINATRLGFASSTIPELEKSVEILKRCLR